MDLLTGLHVRDQDLPVFFRWSHQRSLVCRFAVETELVEERGIGIKLWVVSGKELITGCIVAAIVLILIGLGLGFLFFG